MAWAPASLAGGYSFQGLGDLSGGSFSIRATGVLADGSVVVGIGSFGTSTYGDTPFIWDAGSGLRSLKDVLVTDGGLDLTEWNLIDASGISADGRTIVGYGINPAGQTEAWRATLAPGTLLLLGSVLAGLAACARRRRRS